MSIPRVIRDGEHLDVIAYRHGVQPADVWNDPGNAHLREARAGGHMLKAGDMVVLPERVHPKPVQVFAGGEIQIVARIPKITVTVVLASDGQPLAGEPWHIEGRGERASGVTGADGKVSFEVRVTTPRVTLLLERSGQHREIVVGGLDPDHSVRGIAQRLKNLSLYGEEVVATPTPAFTAALTRFQTDAKLVPSGLVDAQTIAALVAAHGS